MSFRSWSSLACAALVASLSVACATGGDPGQYVGDDGGGDDSSTDPPGDAGTGGDAKPGRDASGSSDATADTVQPDDDGDSSTSNDTGLAATDTGTVVDSGGGGPEGSTSTCNPQNCTSGCCQGDSCVAGAANNACGLTGAVCADCTQIPSATCVSGLCEAPSSNCSSTCSGCCDANNVCHATSSLQYCFTNGGNGPPFQSGTACEDCASENDLLCLVAFGVGVCAL